MFSQTVAGDLRSSSAAHETFKVPKIRYCPSGHVMMKMYMPMDARALNHALVAGDCSGMSKDLFLDRIMAPVAGYGPQNLGSRSALLRPLARMGYAADGASLHSPKGPLCTAVQAPDTQMCSSTRLWSRAAS